MQTSFWGFAAAVFLAVVALCWGVLAVWQSWLGSERKTLARRWQSLAPVSPLSGGSSLRPLRLLSQHAGVERALLQLPGIRVYDQFLLQTGLTLSVADSLLIGLCLALGMVGLSLGLGGGVGLGLVLAWLALMAGAAYLQYQRVLRLVRINAQLPDALDLIARAMQAGHAFTSALLLAAREGKPPLSTELRAVFDEINFGIDTRQALHGLAGRVASEDVRFFVVSVLIQSETGGNLAEILKNTARLIRERQKIAGVIRVLSGEGRISAWILSLLPFALAGALFMVNPGFISTLWTDPFGLKLLYSSLALMLIGIAWMWRLIRIRV